MTMFVVYAASCNHVTISQEKNLIDYIRVFKCAENLSLYLTYIYLCITFDKAMASFEVITDGLV